MFDVRHLFEPLNKELLELMKDLAPDEWDRPTSAGKWTVKDVVAHLLDGNLRALSIQRDRYFGEDPPESTDYKTMVKWLNRLNRDWVKAARRLSPKMLITLHESTGRDVSKYYNSLHLEEESIFPVAWAGEIKSLNWMHLAREFTEKWHHQQQIRDIRDDHSLFMPTFFHTYLRTCFLGLPHLFSDVDAEEGASVRIIVKGKHEYESFLRYHSGKWNSSETPVAGTVTRLTIPQDICWKLFSGNIRPSAISDQVSIEGNKALGKKVLGLVAVMA